MQTHQLLDLSANNTPSEHEHDASLSLDLSNDIKARPNESQNFEHGPHSGFIDFDMVEQPLSHSDVEDSDDFDEGSYENNGIDLSLDFKDVFKIPDDQVEQTRQRRKEADRMRIMQQNIRDREAEFAELEDFHLIANLDSRAARLQPEREPDARQVGQPVVDDSLAKLLIVDSNAFGARALQIVLNQ